eukprot:TRINITY_DN41355_c0_g1_i1.p1 TRINITY_DN41355_c0_g1~~TRINITY_DN41355_c0_g1_i1.p1  ORF type:complete len:422 (+),score=47.23 TRINITY_DN41355_c0_g1_i1:70-1335(+)
MSSIMRLQSFQAATSILTLSSCLAVVVGYSQNARLGQCEAEHVPNTRDAGRRLLQKLSDNLTLSVAIEQPADDADDMLQVAAYKPEAFMSSSVAGQSVPITFVKNLVVNDTLLGGKLVHRPCYNPSLAVLPRDLAIVLDPKAYYVAAVRLSNPQCKRLGSRKFASINRLGGSSIFIMDADFNILQTSLITNVSGRKANVIDVRLFVTGEKVYISYWTPRPDFSFRVQELIVKHSFDGSIVASVGDMVPDFTLKRQRNIGVMQTAHGEWRALLWLADPMYIRPVPVGTTKTAASNRLAWRSEGKDIILHNNINPVELPELNAYLAVGHVALDNSRTVASFASKYVSFFMLFDNKPPFKLQHRSPPVCFPSQSDAARCEIIQFVMSVVLESPSSLLLSYGVNDCEAIIARMQLADMISFIRDR